MQDPKSLLGSLIRAITRFGDSVTGTFVRFRDITDQQAIDAIRLNDCRCKYYPQIGWVWLEEIDQAAADASADVLAYEADGKVSAAMYDDPDLSLAWHLDTLGARNAWGAGALGQGVTVAVLDSGADADHADLVANLMAGYNYIDENADTNDNSGHGTGVASLIAASINNAFGSAGVAPSASIVPLKVLDAGLDGAWSDVVPALIDAVDTYGASVINMSLGGPDQPPQAVADAIAYAAASAFLVASAGNDGEDGSLWPAAYAEVMSVGATNSDDIRATFSNFGSSVDVYAPGSGLWAAHNNGGYTVKAGTSYAAPIVAAIGALALSDDDTLLAADVRQRVMDTASAVAGLDSPFVSAQDVVGAAEPEFCTGTWSTTFTATDQLCIGQWTASFLVQPDGDCVDTWTCTAPIVVRENCGGEWVTVVSVGGDGECVREWSTTVSVGGEECCICLVPWTGA